MNGFLRQNVYLVFHMGMGQNNTIRGPQVLVPVSLYQSSILLAGAPCPRDPWPAAPSRKFGGCSRPNREISSGPPDSTTMRCFAINQHGAEAWLLQRMVPTNRQSRLNSLQTERVMPCPLRPTRTRSKTPACHFVARRLPPSRQLSVIVHSMDGTVVPSLPF